MGVFGLRQRRILVADDDPNIRSLLETVLTAQGYSVETAANGIEAITKLKNARFDLLILDHYMPEMDGLQVLETISSSKKYRDLSVLMLTAETLTGIVNRAFELDVVDYIIKPLDIKSLIDKVNSFFSSK